MFNDRRQIRTLFAQWEIPLALNSLFIFLLGFLEQWGNFAPASTSLLIFLHVMFVVICPKTNKPCIP